MFPPPRILLGIAGFMAVLLAVLGAGAWTYTSGRNAGWESRDLECRAEVQAIRDQLAEAERQGRTWRERGRALADQLAAKELELRTALAESARRLKNEVDKRASASRAAFADARLTRMLNEQTRHDIREHSSSEASASAAKPDGANATAPADRTGPTGNASEKSVARWIVGAQQMYDECRGRLHALQAWARDVTQ